MGHEWNKGPLEWRNEMSILANTKSLRCFVPASALAKSIDFDNAMMRVALLDGRILCVPLAWFPTLRDATPEQRMKYEIGGGGIGLHWPELDEDLSLAGLMAGVDRLSG
jgi:Protein of unknown function (DUF2442)